MDSRVCASAAAALLLFATPVTALSSVGDTIEAPAVAAAPSRLHAVLINGGGTKQINYQSHLLHLRQLRQLLVDTGVDPSRITVFNADGSDPGVDVALRKGQADEDGFWRLRGTSAFQALRVPVVYESSAIDGARLLPATQEAIGRWFDSETGELGDGDTLLLYVTDHGDKNDDDLRDNTIRLWGKNGSGEDEALSVVELRAMLEQLDPAVRVVTLMSQCYSGSFANLIDLGDDTGQGDRDVCGYFAATADRKAYGCYPQNLGKENVGHSFRFIGALAESGSFAKAHEKLLTEDATPDVPLRTSDAYLEELLERAAADAGEEFTPFVDGLLDRAWKDKASWESEVRLLDRIGAAFGYFSPRSLAELEERSEALPDIAGQLTNVSQSWKGALADSNHGNFTRFTEAEPAWSKRLVDARGPDFSAFDARAMSRNIIRELERFTDDDEEAAERIETLYRNAEDAAAMAYRMEVRLAVMLRMRTILLSVAGRHYLESGVAEGARAKFERLRRCEDLSIPASPDSVVRLTEPETYPRYEDDVSTATASLPAWMGIRFRDLEPELREKLELEAGATRVLHVYEDSPAAASGLRVGDIVTGPPARPFREPKRIRSWTMLQEVGREAPLEVLRDDERLVVALVPGEYPLEWPELPGPPKIGEQAPEVELGFYRGEAEQVAAGKPYLLYFWATWCGPCKLAVPGLLEFERATGIPVIAVTDESADLLDPFFAKREDEFPATVALDPMRQTFIRYGVSGTPTFVHVDASGTVKSHSVGYDPRKGFGEGFGRLLGDDDRGADESE